MIYCDTIARFDATKAALEICRIVEEPDSSAPSLCAIVNLGFPPRAPDAFTHQSSCIRESVPIFYDGRSLAIEGRPPKHSPFHSLPDGGLVVVANSIGLHQAHHSIYHHRYPPPFVDGTRSHKATRCGIYPMGKLGPSHHGLLRTSFFSQA